MDFDNAEPQQSIEMKKGKITVEEIASAIKQTKGNRAPGEDRVTADMLKADPHLSAQMLVKLFQCQGRSSVESYSRGFRRESTSGLERSKPDSGVAAHVLTRSLCSGT